MLWGSPWPLGAWGRQLASQWDQAQATHRPAQHWPPQHWALHTCILHCCQSPLAITGQHNFIIFLILSSISTYITTFRVAHIGASWQPGWVEMDRERERERERPLFTTYSSFLFHLPLFLFLFISPLYLSLSCPSLPQKPQITAFVANGKKIWTYALRGNNSGSNQAGRNPGEMCYPVHI